MSDGCVNESLRLFVGCEARFVGEAVAIAAEAENVEGGAWDERDEREVLADE